jgi:hypothetical protein
MSDYQNSDFDPFNPEDPYRRGAKMDPDVRAMNAVWGWMAAAIFVVVVLAVAFGMTHQAGQIGTNTASNDTPSAATRMSPPISPMAPSRTNQPGTTLAPPISPAPNAAPAAPGQPTGDQ